MPSPSRPGRRSLLSGLVSRLAFFTRAMGWGDEDNPTLYRVLGYDRKISLRQYRARYNRGGIAHRIVNFLPDHSWTGGVYMVENEDPKVITPFEREAEKLFDRLTVPLVFRRADIQSGLGYYSGILIGARGKLTTPLPPLHNQSDIRFLIPYSQDRLRISSFDEDPESPRFGQPETYRLDIRQGISADGDKEFTSFESVNTSADYYRTVHHSRIIHISKGGIDNNIFGLPILKPSWNLFHDLYKLTGSGAKSAWTRTLGKILLDLDKDLADSDEIDRKDLKKKVEEMYDDEKEYALTVGVTPKPTQGQVFNFASNVSSVISQIAGTHGIPRRELDGSERGELASSQDKKIVSNLISNHRILHCNQWLGTFTARLVEYGALPTPAKHTPIWYEEENPLSDKDKASIVQSISSANSVQVSKGDTPVLSSDEMRDMYYGKKPLKEFKSKAKDRAKAGRGDKGNKGDNPNDPDNSDKDVN